MLLVLAAVLLTPQGHAQPNYCFGFLEAVPGRPTLHKEEAERIQAAHIAHLTALGKKRWLRAAGPIATPGAVRGILISKCRSVREANELASADPAVKQGRLLVKSYSWRGPEGIADRYWKMHESDPQLKDKMAAHALVILRRTASITGEMKPVTSSGRLAAGGPFLDSPEILGVLVYRNTSLEEARKLAESERAVPPGATVELLEWWVDENVLP